MTYIILSNNNKVIEHYSDVVVVEGNYIDVLNKARDLIHIGHRLISSPLGASIKMLYSPVKTLMLTPKMPDLDSYSIDLIESSINKYKITLGERLVDMKNKKDYELIDFTLFESANDEYANFKNISRGE